MIERKYSITNCKSYDELLRKVRWEIHTLENSWSKVYKDPDFREFASVLYGIEQIIVYEMEKPIIGLYSCKDMMYKYLKVRNETARRIRYQKS